MAHKILHHLATIYLFRSHHSSFALFISAALICVESILYLPSCFIILCFCSFNSIAWELPSNSTFNILSGISFPGENASVLPVLLQAECVSGCSSTLGTAPLYLFTQHTIVFIPLPPSLNQEFFQGRNCITLIFIKLVLHPGP